MVSDPHGKACREMIGSILKGDTPEQAVKLAGKLKADRAEIGASLDHELTDSHVYLDWMKCVFLSVDRPTPAKGE
jgi:transposase